MAGLAAEEFPVRPGPPHQLVKLALVRIGVAACAGLVAPVVQRGWRLEVQGKFVAIAADDCLMTSSEREPGFLVPGQAERGGPESQQTVAAFAAVRVGCDGELGSMGIIMAIGATLKLDFVERASALGNMTLRAGHGRVLPFQGISGCGVLFHAEGRRLEAFHGVARRALTAAHPLGKLAAMRIGFVTIHALLENQRLLEISLGVALHAFD